MTETTTQTTVVFVSLSDLRKQVREARLAMIEAWHAQSQMTAEEGYTIEQANEAILQAQIAQAYYETKYAEWEAENWRDAGLFPASETESEYEYTTPDGVYSL